VLFNLLWFSFDNGNLVIPFFNWTLANDVGPSSHVQSICLTLLSKITTI
jgi:hypothetical protein